MTQGLFMWFPKPSTTSWLSLVGAWFSCYGLTLVSDVNVALYWILVSDLWPLLSGCFEQVWSIVYVQTLTVNSTPNPTYLIQLRKPHLLMKTMICSCKLWDEQVNAPYQDYFSSPVNPNPLWHGGALRQQNTFLTIGVGMGLTFDCGVEQSV